MAKERTYSYILEKMRYLMLLAFPFFINNSYAQDILYKDINEVVITGQLSEKSAEEAVHKVRIISGKKLKSGLFTDLGQILEKELNIRLTQDNILGSSISLQGISGQNVKILIDDVPVIGRMNGNLDLSQINLNNIERIEIIEGPLSSIYGTDALAGTINIITNKSNDSQRSINTYFETIGKYNIDFLLSNNIENQNITYQFGRNYFNGWIEGQEFNLIPTPQIADKKRFKSWKPKEQYINKIQHNLSQKNMTIYNYIDHFYEKITNLGPPKAPYFENAFDEYYHTNRINIGSNIKQSVDDNEVKILLAYNKYTRHKERFYNDLTTLSTSLVKDNSSQDTSSFNLFLAKLLISDEYKQNLQYQIGVEAQSESAKGDRIAKNFQKQSDYAIFSIIEYNPNDKITIRPSARAIHNTNYNAPFIPSLNILIDFNNYKLRFGAAKGFRAPSLKELYLEFVDINHNIVGNSNLSAERSYNYHINNSYKYKTSGYILNTDVNIFYNSISDKIDLVNSNIQNNQYSYFNIDEYKTAGTSGNIKITKKNTEINIGTSHIGRYHVLGNSESLSDFYFSTDHSINAIFNIGTSNKLNIFYKHVGKLPTFVMVDNNIIKSYTDSYNLLDCSYNKRIGENFTFSIGVKNLLDIKDVKKTNQSSTVHSSNNNSVSITYGRTLFISIKSKL